MAPLPELCQTLPSACLSFALAPGQCPSTLIPTPRFLPHGFLSHLGLWAFPGPASDSHTFHLLFSLSRTLYSILPQIVFVIQPCNPILFTSKMPFLDCPAWLQHPTYILLPVASSCKQLQSVGLVLCLSSLSFFSLPPLPLIHCPGYEALT